MGIFLQRYDAKSEIVYPSNILYLCQKLNRDIANWKENGVDVQKRKRNWERHRERENARVCVCV